MQTTDLLNLYLIGASNAVLVRHDSPDFSNLSMLMRLSLTPEPSEHSPVWFKVSEDLRSYTAWVQDLKQQGARALKLISLEDLSLPSKTSPLQGIPDTQFHGFDGTSNLVLVVLWDDHTEAWHARLEYPRETDLQVSDILAFLGKSGCAEALKEKMLWENANNLHYYETEEWKAGLASLKPNTGENFFRSQQFESLLSYWEPFVQTISADRVEGFVQAFSQCCNNAEIPENEGNRWSMFYEKHRQSGSLSFFYERIGVFGRTLPLVHVEEDVSMLRDCLDRIAVYADAQAEKQWGGFFREGIQRLEHLNPETAGLLVNPLRALKASEEAIRVLSAALFVSDAFGGMGSWNDLPIYQEPEYERLSNDLLKAINKTFVAGASLL